MSQETEKTLLWYEILDNVFEVAFEFGYGNYRLRYVSDDKAISAIRRHFKTLSKGDAAEAIKKCYQLIDAIYEVHRKFSKELKDPPRNYELRINESSLDKYVIELKKLCPEFGFLTCQKALVTYLRVLWFE